MTARNINTVNETIEPEKITININYLQKQLWIWIQACYILLWIKKFKELFNSLNKKDIEYLFLFGDENIKNQIYDYLEKNKTWVWEDYEIILDAYNNVKDFNYSIFAKFEYQIISKLNIFLKGTEDPEMIKKIMSKCTPWEYIYDKAKQRLKEIGIEEKKGEEKHQIVITDPTNLNLMEATQLWSREINDSDAKIQLENLIIFRAREKLKNKISLEDLIKLYEDINPFILRLKSTAIENMDISGKITSENETEIMIAGKTLEKWPLYQEFVNNLNKTGFQEIKKSKTIENSRRIFEMIPDLFELRTKAKKKFEKLSNKMDKKLTKLRADFMSGKTNYTIKEKCSALLFYVLETVLE